MPATAPRLRRDLGLLGLTATGICSMVGAGINIVPFALQRTVPGIGGHVLVAYLLAAVPAVLAALCYAMLGRAMPRAGGSYVYASRAIGPYAGFLASFSQWFGLCMAIGVVSYVIPPFLRDTARAASWPALAAVLDARPVRLGLALALLWLFVAVNVRGVRAVARTLVPLMVLMFGCGGLVIATGFLHSVTDFTALAVARGEGALLAAPSGDPWRTIPAAAAVLFSSFIGFDAIAQAGGEARAPMRSIPLAIGLAVAGVGSFYLLFTAAVYHAVPWGYVANASAAGDVTAPGLLASLTSAPVAVLMVAGAAVSLVNDLPGMLLGVSRLCFAWAEDGIVPARLAALHPRHGTPHVALGASAGLASLGIVGNHLAGDFFVGVDILVTAMLVNFLVMAVAVLRLPRRIPALGAALGVLPSRALQVAVALLAIGLLATLLAVHTMRDLGAEAAGWWAHPTLVWLLVMAAGSLLYLREARALARRGGDLAAITRQLPPE